MNNEGYILKWNLDVLFKDSDEFYKKIEEVRVLLSDIKKYENIVLDSDILYELLNKKWLIKEYTNNILVYGSLMYYKNVKSSLCINMKKDAETFNNEVNASLNFIDVKILNLGKDIIYRFLKENNKLKLYKFSIENLFRLNEHIKSLDINLQILENNKIIDEQLSLYNELLNSISYGNIIVGEEKIELTPSNFNKYISNRDRNIRRDTYLSVNESFEKEGNKFASILEKICDCRKDNAKYEDYDTVLKKVLFEENIDSKVIDSLIKSVNDNIYLIQKYLRAKAMMLGIDDAHLYDFNVELSGELDIKYSLDEALDIIRGALRPLGSRYLEVVEKLLDGHIDALLDEDKHQSITFSWNTYSFMNFRGRYVDLKNLIHEIGHIVNYYLSYENEPFIYADSTIFIGEVSSIVNEILLNKYLYNNATSAEEKIFYLSKEIENYFTSVFKQTMYTEFENEIYNNSDLSSDNLSRMYSNIVKKYYGNSVIYDSVFSTEWTRVGHLFRWSYYVYKYATGLLSASIIVKYLENGSISRDGYLNFLSFGSSKYSLELLNSLEVDLCNDKVIVDGFKILEEDIDNFYKIAFKYAFK